MLDPRLLTGEARRLSCPHAEAVKTMKQIGPVARPGTARDRVDGAALGHRRPQSAVRYDGGGHLGEATGEPHTEQETTTEQEGMQPSEPEITPGDHRCAFQRGCTLGLAAGGAHVVW